MSKNKSEELWAVRHVVTGQYMNATMHDIRVNAQGLDRPVTLAVRWGEQNDASVMTRAQADLASGAYIALAGDKDIEIEPVVEEVL